MQSRVVIGDGSDRVLLLTDLQHLFARKGIGRLSSAEPVDTVIKREDRPWPEWRSKKPITATAVASA